MRMATISILVALELSGITGQLYPLAIRHCPFQLATICSHPGMDVVVAQALKQFDREVFDGGFGESAQIFPLRHDSRHAQHIHNQPNQSLFLLRVRLSHQQRQRRQAGIVDDRLSLRIQQATIAV